MNKINIVSSLGYVIELSSDIIIHKNNQYLILDILNIYNIKLASGWL